MKNKISRKTLNLILISLVVVVMLTTVLSGSLLAKYATSAEADVQVARVAKFNIEGAGVTEYNITSENIRPGYKHIQPIRISNDSEVAVEYTLSATKTPNLPLVFKIGDKVIEPMIITGSIPIGGDDFETELHIVWPEEIKDPSYSMMVDAVKLTLSVVQVD